MTGQKRAPRLGVFAAASALLLAGCAVVPSPAHPDFDLPAQWSGLDMSILLRADGTAALEGVPGGQWEQTDDGICSDAADETFTGEATWSVFSQRGVELFFEDSDVIVWANPGKFASWGWNELTMVTCGGTQSFSLSVVCGRAGYAEEDPCRQPEEEAP